MARHALGPFRLDAQDDLLLRGSEPVALGRRAIALLRALVERPGAVLSKDALIAAAWPHQAVEESNLTVQIAALRRALGDAPGGERWIETMPRRGYRFVGPVVPEGKGDVAGAGKAAGAGTGASSSLYDEAEHRHVTAMSCELVGIPGQASDVDDLEDWGEAVDAFQRCVSAAAERHNGFLATCLGNTALILFGYPIAHEHDAEQAVRAGLELCAAVRSLRSVAGTPLRCRVGIATGMVIAGNSIGPADRRDHEIIGDAPEFAARLQIAAEPGAVVIESATRHLLGDLFECRDPDAIATSRDADGIRCWQVHGERVVESRFEALRGLPLYPLIGRDEEIAQLLARWERAKAGNGQTVLISGEPGIGKSRIAAGLKEHLRDEPHFRIGYYCSPYHQDSALAPIVDQLARAAQFLRDDPPEIRLEKLKSLLARVGTPDEDMVFFADLLALPVSGHNPLRSLSPRRKKQRTFEALVRQLEGLARRQPVMVVFEDVHWIDASSRELLDLAVERLRSLPVLLIVTFRPEFHAPWMGEPRVTTLALRRLERSDRIALARQVAGGKSLPREVIAQIVERTDGVPLFVEELTKSVLESGALREEEDRYVLDRSLPSLAIPTTLNASLMARLDRSASMRRVAQIGAAIGREFSYALLRAASGIPEEQLKAALAGLVASELVFRRDAPGAAYSFKHALVQDAAHDSMLRSVRRQLHARIAEVLETDSPEVADVRPELLAQHYAEAGLVEKSVISWGNAAQRSVLRSEMAEAAAQFQKGLDQLALLPDSPARQRQELVFLSGLGASSMAVKGFAAPETGEAYGRARALWERLGSPSEFLQIPYGQSEYHINRGELDLAHRFAEDLLHLSGQRNDTSGLVLGHYACGLNQLSAGRFSSSRMHMEESLALYDPARHHLLVHQAGVHPHVNSQAFLALVLFCLGYPDRALALSNAAIEEARRLAHPPSLAASASASSRLLSLIGANAALLHERADELIAVAAEQGFPRWHALGTIYRGWARVNDGDVAEGLSLLHGGSTAFRGAGDAIWTPHYTALLAGAHALAGEIDEAAILLDDALGMVARTGERWFAAELNRQKGQLLHEQGHWEAAEACYLEASAVARQQDAKLWELRAAVGLARLRCDQGRHAAARGCLAPVYGWFTEGFGTPDLQAARALLDALP